MMELTKQRFYQSDYAMIPGNKVTIDDQTDYTSGEARLDLDQMVQDQGEYRKLVIGSQASGSALPFPDDWFTSYVSNLVLMLVDSSVNMIREAYRVLKPGSTAAFTVWGRRENSMIFTAKDIAEQRIRESQGQQAAQQNDTQPANAVSNFDFSRDIEHFEEVFREAGFNQIKHWYQMQNQRIRTGEELI